MNPRIFPAISRRVRDALLAACCTLAWSANAQDFGDTPYVQTPANVVKAMLETAKVGPKDYVIDLGSGDGRMVITAAKEYGARGFGVDHDARLVRLANANAAKEGVADRAVFYARDLYKTDVHRATVMSIYLLPEVNLMVRPKLLRELKPGTRIVSHDYDMGEWKPDAQFKLEAPGKTVGRDPVSKVFYWVVPANVTGEWSATVRTSPKPQEITLRLAQKFQFAEGSIEAGDSRVPLEHVKLVGPHLTFEARLPSTAGSATVQEFSGRVAGDSIEGTLKTAPNERAIAWRARRVGGKVAIGPEIDPKLAELKAGSGMQ
ncbi:MAG: SAM-dependent methyltransferase [Burkholderiales bacterium]